jgi:hypothetical protein
MDPRFEARLAASVDTVLAGSPTDCGKLIADIAVTAWRMVKAKN